MENSFKCQKCSHVVKTQGNIGTKNRNHCPECLYSLHVDDKIPGDRESKCFGLMKPIDIVFKKDRVDKYGNEKKGEMMILHECSKCKKQTKNRLAGDDNDEKILGICKNKKDLEEIKKQLYGITKNEF